MRCTPSHARALHPPSLIEPGVSRPTRNGCGAVSVEGFEEAVSLLLQARVAARMRRSTARFMCGGFYGWTVDGCQWYTGEVVKEGTDMDDTDRSDGAE